MLASLRELAKHAVSEGTKAVTKYNMSFEGASSQRMSKSARAGLVFPIGRIMSYMKRVLRMRINVGAPVYLAAVLEVRRESSRDREAKERRATMLAGWLAGSLTAHRAAVSRGRGGGARRQCVSRQQACAHRPSPCDAGDRQRRGAQQDVQGHGDARRRRGAQHPHGAAAEQAVQAPWLLGCAGVLDRAPSVPSVPRPYLPISP